MSWSFLWLNRGSFKGDYRWGTLYIRTRLGKWERLCYSYELPWKANSTDKSLNKISRIRIGEYSLKPRHDGDKGWRLELEGTGHRMHIQIHRAHKSLYIEGCILPVHFDDRGLAQISEKMQIQQKSVMLMAKIKQRYSFLKKSNVGKAKIVISANLPAQAGIAA
ncbi:hypothetical protein KC799_08250 [candidate division KSB1 bacterium]|nr:hypothetical protein [candidate division KSB1 bacterium]